MDNQETKELYKKFQKENNMMDVPYEDGKDLFSFNMYILRTAFTNLGTELNIAYREHPLVDFIEELNDNLRTKYELKKGKK